VRVIYRKIWYINRQINEIEELRSLVRQLTKSEEGEQIRFKRGVFNFIGEISKILFGTMDSGVKERVAGSYGERCATGGCHRRLPKGALVTLQD